MYPRKVLIALGIAVFVVSLLVFAPARILLALVPESSSFRQASVSGDIAAGHLHLPTSAGLLAVEWQLSPWKLLTLAVGGSWHATADGLDVSGDFALRPWGFFVAVVDGSIAPGLLNQWVGGGNVSMEQPLRLDDVQVRMSLGGLRSVTGSLAWAGGPVQVQGQAGSLNVPALSGRIDTEGEVVRLVVSSKEAPDQPLAGAEADLASRQLHVEVKGRMARVLGLPEGQRMNEDAAFFELRQPLP